MTRPPARDQRAALILAFVSLALIPVLLLSIPLFTEVKNMLQTGAAHELRLEAETVAGRVDMEFEATLNRALRLAAERGVQRATQGRGLKAGVEAAFGSFLQGNRAVSALYLLGSHGNALVIAPRKTGARGAARLHPGLLERCMAFRGAQSGFSEFYADPGDPKPPRDNVAITLAIPVFNPGIDVWSGALCIVIPWKSLLRAALSRISPRPVLSDVLLDGQSLLHSAPASSPIRDLVRASVPLGSRAFEAGRRRVSVQVAESRMLWLTRFYNTLASFVLVATALVASVGWLAFWLLKRAMENPGGEGLEATRETPVVIPLRRPRSRASRGRVPGDTDPSP